MAMLCLASSPSFSERLYQIEHPRLVAQFDEMCDVQQGEPGYWISKAWLKGIPIYLFHHHQFTSFTWDMRARVWHG